MDYHKFIYDEEEVKKFIKILSPLVKDEVYFLSVSARSKYLTDLEKEVLILGKQSWFSRKLVKPSPIDIKHNYIRVVKSMEVAKGGYTSQNGLELSNSCLVIYANINPSSGMKALKKFQNETMDIMYKALASSKQPLGLCSLDSKMLSCYQTEISRKTLIDVDFDIPRDGLDLVRMVAEELKNKKVKYYTIITKSGYHMILDKESLNFNYTLVVAEADRIAKERYGNEHIEVKINSNNAVPLPGTLQGGFEVRFIDV